MRRVARVGLVWDCAVAGRLVVEGWEGVGIVLLSSGSGKVASVCSGRGLARWLGVDTVALGDLGGEVTSLVGVWEREYTVYLEEELFLKMSHQIPADESL